MNKKTLASMVLISLIACFLIPSAYAQDWQISEDWGGGTATPTATTTATPSANNADLPIILLTVVWLAFVVLGLLSKSLLGIGIAGIISVLYGIFIAIWFLGSDSSWVYQIVGFAVVMFGFAFMVMAATKGGGKKQK